MTYEAMAIAAAAGVRYREMMFSPTFVMRHGVPFDTIWAGHRGRAARTPRPTMASWAG